MNIQLKKQFSIALKMVMLFLIFLLLLIPIASISMLLRDRNSISTGAENEMVEQNGGNPVFLGPVLVIPYTRQVRMYDSEDKLITKYYPEEAAFLPHSLDITATIYPEMKNRGIYQAILSNTDLMYSGSFIVQPDIFLQASEIHFEKAYISVELEGTGIKTGAGFNFDGQDLEYSTSTSGADFLNSALRYPVKTLNLNGSYQFTGSISFTGGPLIQVIPSAVESTIRMESTWQDPSFTGSKLPDTKGFEDGFFGEWSILSVNHNLPRFFQKDEAPNFLFSALGVRLIQPVDKYLMSSRSMEYAMLFLIIPFVFFFMIEVIAGQKIHPIQYILAGFADILFYTLLISFSEHINFSTSFIISSAAVIGLLSFYSFSIVREKLKALLILPVLTLAYTFLYIIIRSEDYALLLGSILLFLILGTVMALTRKVDWYALGESVKDLEGEDTNHQVK
jgi:inner membrane protein